MRSLAFTGRNRTVVCRVASRAAAATDSAVRSPEEDIEQGEPMQDAGPEVGSGMQAESPEYSPASTDQDMGHDIVESLSHEMCVCVCVWDRLECLIY